MNASQVRELFSQVSEALSEAPLLTDADWRKASRRTRIEIICFLTNTPPVPSRLELARCSQADIQGLGQLQGVDVKDEGSCAAKGLENLYQLYQHLEVLEQEEVDG